MNSKIHRCGYCGQPVDKNANPLEALVRYTLELDEKDYYRIRDEQRGLTYPAGYNKSDAEKLITQLNNDSEGLQLQENWNRLFMKHRSENYNGWEVVIEKCT